MHRLAAILLATLALLAAGCGGNGNESGGSAATTPTTVAKPPPDPGRNAMRALVDAARTGDAPGVQDLLSKRVQRPAAAARTLIRELRPYFPGYDVVVSELIAERVGVVAIKRGKHAFAVPLRVEGGELRVEPTGPVSIAILGPRPGAREKVGQIGVEVHGRGSGSVAVLYADGVTLTPRVYPGPKSATVFSNLEAPLTPGRHVAVAFASRGGYPAARAWTFVAR